MTEFVLAGGCFWCLDSSYSQFKGIIDVECGYAGGHAITKPLIFAGRELSLNFSTSAAGGVKVGFEEVDGTPIPGFSVEDCVMQIGNEIDRRVSWKSGRDVSALAGKPVRLRFSMKDADVYSFQFTE